MSTGLQSDIRMNFLQLPKNLLTAAILVPYVDKLNDGKTPFLHAVRNYIGGAGNKDFNALVPGESTLSPLLALRFMS